MKVICPKNCLKKQCDTEIKKQMAYIGESTFISKKPKIQVEVVRSEKAYKIIQIGK